MALEEKTVSIVLDGVDFIRKMIKDKIGPSKKELKIQVEELEKIVAKLVDQNTQMSSSMENISQAILDQLSTEYNIEINVDTITIIGQNTNNLINYKMDDHSVTNNLSIEKNAHSFQMTDVFLGIDEEIAGTRVKPMAQLEEEYDINKFITRN